MIDFEAEVNKYGESLSTDEKDKARAAFNELLAQGRTFEWLYYAIKQLNGRSIQKYPKLLFYKGFQEEVDALLLKGKDILNDSYYDFPYRHWRTNIVSILNRSEEEFMARYNREKKEFELAYYANCIGEGYMEVSQEEKDFSNNYFNESFEYKLEHEEEIMALYDKYFVLPYLEEALKYD